MYQMYIDIVLFPVTPGKLQVNINGTNKTITLINEGEVNLIKTPGLTDISTEVLLPALTEYPFARYPVDFCTPDWYLRLLETWKQSKKPVSFKMLRTSPDGKELLWNTNIPVTIEDYKIIEDADSQGLDVVVNISMKEYRKWGVKKLKKLFGRKAVVQKLRPAKSPAKSYVVKKGDSLFIIAKKQLGNSARWKEIYELNKKAIESQAKKHGKPGNGSWILQGEKLKLPKK